MNLFNRIRNYFAPPLLLSVIHQQYAIKEVQGDMVLEPDLCTVPGIVPMMGGRRTADGMLYQVCDRQVVSVLEPHEWVLEHVITGDIYRGADLIGRRVSV